MAEYIDKRKVIELIKNYGKGAIADGVKSLDPVDDIIYLAKGVDMIPVADLQEVRHGKWIYVDEVLDYADCKCSECNNVYTFEAYHPGCLYNFCPFCGAKMDKEREK